MPNLVINTYGRAGTVTQSGARVKTIFLADPEVEPGLPVKLADDGTAVLLAAGDASSVFAGILVADPAGFAPKFSQEMRGALDTGFIQVPLADGVTPKLNDLVYFDPAAKKYSNATGDGFVQLPAQFAVSGNGGGIGEIRVFPAILAAAAAPSEPGLTQDAADARYRLKTEAINLAKDSDVNGALPVKNGGTGATTAAAALEALGGQPKASA